jgi:hypothetical protein
MLQAQSMIKTLPRHMQSTHAPFPMHYVSQSAAMILVLQKRDIPFKLLRSAARLRPEMVKSKQ